MIRRGRLLGVLAVLAAAIAWALPGSALAAPGDLDKSFGSDGTSQVDLGASESVTNMELQPDGKIVVSGDRNGDIIVARLLNPSGALDNSYGGGFGWSRLDFGNIDAAGGLALRPDGRINVGGSAPLVSGGFRFVVAQLLNPQGIFDSSFGGGSGYLQSHYTALSAPNFQDYGNSIALQGGSIIVAGSSGPDFSTQDFAASRVTPSGNLDIGFGNDGGGMAFVNFGTYDSADDVAVQPDGKVVLTGYTSSGIGVARFSADGIPDGSFSGDGKAVFPGTEGWSVAVQPDGKILIAGHDGPDAVVMRLKSDGSLDNSFAGDGRLGIDFGDTSDQLHDIALQQNGKIVLAGESGHSFGFGGYAAKVAVARVLPNGLLDATFADGGKKLIASGEYAAARGVRVQGDGNIVVAGSVAAGNGADIFLTRLEGDPPNASLASGKCAGKKATVIGTNLKDKLKGTKKKDVISAGNGKDTVKGLKGNDLICGGKGKDRLFGGPGNDKLLGQQGKDFLKGGPGKKDKVKGGAGKDVEKP